MEPGLLKQEKAFLDHEGDAWFNRNFHKMEREDDPVIDILKNVNLSGREILEYGCANGWRLNKLMEKYRSSGSRPACFGVDPSSSAIQAGQLRFPDLHLDVGTVLSPYKDCSLIIYGFCLYLCERNQLSMIAAIGDDGLMDQGYIIIHDFDPDHDHCVPYHHLPGAYSYKMDYSRLWLANPAYSLVEKIKPDRDTAIWVLKKDLIAGWPVEELK